MPEYEIEFDISYGALGAKVIIPAETPEEAEALLREDPDRYYDQFGYILKYDDFVGIDIQGVREITKQGKGRREIIKKGWVEGCRG